MKRSQALPQPVFTLSTKAAVGDHDENITFADMQTLLGTDLAGQVRDISLNIYAHAAAHAQKRGMILADTKFEFGLDKSGRLHLNDEVLTHDSTQLWPAV